HLVEVVLLGSLRGAAGGGVAVRGRMARRVGAGDVRALTLRLMPVTDVNEHRACKHDAHERPESKFAQSPEIHPPALVGLVIAMRQSCCHKLLKGLTYFPARKHPAASGHC